MSQGQKSAVVMDFRPFSRTTALGDRKRSQKPATGN
jgi:hypothetical protein